MIGAIASRVPGKMSAVKNGVRRRGGCARVSGIKLFSPEAKALQGSATAGISGAPGSLGERPRVLGRWIDDDVNIVLDLAT